jgi:Protein of unknown function (DUF4199)
MDKIPLHWRYAAITGIALIAWMLFEYIMGWHASPIGAKTTNVTIILFLIGLFFSIRQTRDVTLNGFIDVKIGMLVGLQFALIVGVVSAVGVFIYYQFINPNFATYWASQAELQIIADKKPPEFIAQVKQNYIASVTPIKQATQRVLFTILGGAFASMVLSFLLRNTKTDA